MRQAPARSAGRGQAAHACLVARRRLCNQTAAQASGRPCGCGCLYVSVRSHVFFYGSQGTIFKHRQCGVAARARQSSGSGNVDVVCVLSLQAIWGPPPGASKGAAVPNPLTSTPAVPPPSPGDAANVEATGVNPLWQTPKAPAQATQKGRPAKGAAKEEPTSALAVRCIVCFQGHLENQSLLSRTSGALRFDLRHTTSSVY